MHYYVTSTATSIRAASRPDVCIRGNENDKGIPACYSFAILLWPAPPGLVLHEATCTKASRDLIEPK